MSGAERLATLDALEAELARLQTNRLRMIAGLEEIGYAQEIGAHDTVQLLAFRFRIDRPKVRRDVRLALALSKYAEVEAALFRNRPLRRDRPIRRTRPARRSNSAGSPNSGRRSGAARR